MPYMRSKKANAVRIGDELSDGRTVTRVGSNAGSILIHTDDGRTRTLPGYFVIGVKNPVDKKQQQVTSKQIEIKENSE
jgi:hypothetical protein